MTVRGNLSAIYEDMNILQPTLTYKNLIIITKTFSHKKCFSAPIKHPVKSGLFIIVSHVKQTLPAATVFAYMPLTLKKRKSTSHSSVPTNRPI